VVALSYLVVAAILFGCSKYAVIAPAPARPKSSMGTP